MAITLPLPFRVAAGILGTGIDLVRSLPDDLPALPVTLVGNAMKLSIKVQQEIATLATRGDELLGGVIGGPEENPSWAKFDDDEPVAPVTTLRTAPPVTSPKSGSAEVTSKGTVGATDKNRPRIDESVPAATADAPADESAADASLTTPDESSMPPGTTIAMEAALEVDPALIDEALIAVDEDPILSAAPNPSTATDETSPIETSPIETSPIETAVDGAPIVVPDEVVVVLDEVVVPGDEGANDEGDPLPATVDDLEQELAVEVLRAQETDDPGNFDENPVVFEETAELTEGLPVPDGLLEDVQESLEDVQESTDSVVEESDGPTVLPGYDGMTLAQVRGHLRDLTPDDVSVLLRWEQDGDSRPPFLTLLSNRLVTLDAQNQ